MYKIATLLTDNVLAAAAQQHAKPEHALSQGD